MISAGLIFCWERGREMRAENSEAGVADDLGEERT